MVNNKRRNFLTNFVFTVICFLLSSLVVIILVVVLPNTAGLNLMPNKPLEIICVWIFFFIIYFICIKTFHYFKLNIWIKTAILLPNLIALPVVIILIATFINTLIFTESVSVGLYEGIPYSIVVRNDDNAQDVDDLENYRIEMLKGIDEPGIHSLLQVSTDWKYTTVYPRGGLEQMAVDLMNNNVQAIVVRQERLEYLNDNVKDFRDNTRVIYEFGLESESYKSGDEAQLLDSFAIYINGVDSFGKTESVTEENEVNILMIVNRKQKKILFVNIPREYYVRLAGMSDVKDEFSSVGLYGIKESVETVEQLYDMDVTFYACLDLEKINDIITQLGGIEITSRDTDNGIQQVVEAMIKKIIGTDILRRNYGNILQAMDGSFRTDIPNGTLMVALVSQIVAKHDWQFESISAEENSEATPTSDRIEENDETASESGTSEDSSADLLEPNQTSVLNVKKKIENILYNS